MLFFYSIKKKKRKILAATATFGLKRGHSLRTIAYAVPSLPLGGGLFNGFTVFLF